jgi:hypothetical protein
VSGLAAGYYQVTITDTAGCQRQLSTLIYQPHAIVVSSVTVVPISAGSAGNIIVSASASGDSLSYAMDTGSYQSGAIFVTSSPGVHIIHIKNQSGCVYDTAIGIYYTGIENHNDATLITLTPNPVSGTTILTIRSDVEVSASMALRDMTGRVVSADAIQVQTGIQQKRIDMSSLSDGVYILTLSGEGGTLASMKVLVIK